MEMQPGVVEGGNLRIEKFPRTGTNSKHPWDTKVYYSNCCNIRK